MIVDSLSGDKCQVAGYLLQSAEETSMVIPEEVLNVVTEEKPEAK